jgi:hypothetical protein
MTKQEIENEFLGDGTLPEGIPGFIPNNHGYDPAVKIGSKRKVWKLLR